MDYLPEIQQKRIFSKRDAIELTGDARRAESVLLSYQKKGYIRKIRRDLYCMVNLANGLPDADRFEVACAIQPEACVAYHSALEYHGLAHQFWYDVQVAVPKSFTAFEFADSTFLPVINKCTAGIEEPRFQRGVRVTNRERTVIDCILRMDLAGGAEEFLHCMEGLSPLRADELSVVLQAYHSPVAYQKAGCVLDLLRLPIDCPEKVLSLCEGSASKAVNFLTNREDSRVYQCKWKLYVPECLTVNNN